jgi:hypothetical protein
MPKFHGVNRGDFPARPVVDFLDAIPTWNFGIG